MNQSISTWGEIQKMKLTFSAVDNPEIPILLQVFGSTDVEINEVVGRALLVD